MIRIENLSKSFGSKLLFNNASFHFPEKERIAIVGANGAGKTTLLNIICNLEEADEGKILLPNRAIVGFLPQEANSNPQKTVLLETIAGAKKLENIKKEKEMLITKMNERYTEELHNEFEKIEIEFRINGGYELETRAKSILTGLGFLQNDFSKNPKELSGGWRMRLELAKIFLNRPDLLILDEPTNHLDLPSLAWTEKYLKSFDGTIIFVSHDKFLLNRLARYIVHLHAGKFNAYKGNFDSFLEQREARALEEASKSEQLKKQREHLEHFIERFGAKATKAKQAQSKMKALLRIRELEADIIPDDDDETLTLRLPEPLSCGKEVCLIENGSIGYEQILVDKINLKINRGQKIAIIGLNGIGKSTLLKTIAQKIKNLSGTFKLGHNVKLDFFTQNQSDVLDENLTILENVMNVSQYIVERKARQILGSFLFKSNDVYKPVKVLSGGEKSRVGLCRLMLSSANFLLLDEPTNHLDMSSVNILAEAISEYSGTILYVSHDREFIDATCTHVFVMLPDGRSALFEGKLDDYERLAKLSDFPNVLDPAINLVSESSNLLLSNIDKQDDNEKAQFLKKDKQKIEKTLQRIEKEISELSIKLGEIEKDMHEAAEIGDYIKLTNLTEIQKKLNLILSDKENEWLLQSENFENIINELKKMGRS